MLHQKSELASVSWLHGFKSWPIAFALYHSSDWYPQLYPHLHHLVCHLHVAFQVHEHAALMHRVKALLWDGA